MEFSTDVVFLSVCCSSVEAFDTPCEGSGWLLIYRGQIHDIGD